MWSSGMVRVNGDAFKLLSTSSPSSDDLTMVYVIVAVVGGVAFLLLILAILVVFCYCCFCRKISERSSSSKGMWRVLSRE